MTQTVHDSLKNYRDNIEYHLETARNLAQDMQTVATMSEGDSDLTRYLGMYFVPGMNHWLTGNQAGNMKFLKELLERRETGQVAKEQESVKINNDDKVLTKSKKK